MSDLLKAYRVLPAFLRNPAAGAWGLYLRSWRYGRETEGLIEAAVERESWTAEKWSSWRDETTAILLHRAARQVPFYRAYWEKRKRTGDTASFERLDDWPILEKETIRQNPALFLADDCSRKNMYHEHTSGTTAKPLDLWWSRKTVRAWYALFEARCRGWYHVSRRDRWAILGGRPVVPADQEKPPFWIWNAGLNQLYLSSYHLSASGMSYYFDALVKYRITYLMGYPSALHALALHALETGRTDLKMAVVIANAEPVYTHQRAAIEKAFHCPLCETYGMAEIVAAASECPNHRMHLWPEVGRIEVLDDDGRPAELGESGSLICTGLLNPDMPLIRYRIGDRGALSAAQVACPCGRLLPVLDSIDGRSDDVVVTPDGRKIGRLDPVFKEALPVREAQIVQESLSSIVVNVVPDTAFDASDEKELTNRMKLFLGNRMSVRLRRVESIPRTQNGKFRAVVSRIGRE
jgi:phenylacetate-CoA ligase